MPTFRNTVFHLHRQVPAYENGKECSETSAYKIQMPGNYPEENEQHTEHSESLKSRIKMKSVLCILTTCEFSNHNILEFF